MRRKTEFKPALLHLKSNLVFILPVVEGMDKIMYSIFAS